MIDISMLTIHVGSQKSRKNFSVLRLSLFTDLIFSLQSPSSAGEKKKNEKKNNTASVYRLFEATLFWSSTDFANHRQPKLCGSSLDLNL